MSTNAAQPVSSQRSAVSSQQSAVSNQQSAVSSQQSAVNRPGWTATLSQAQQCWHSEVPEGVVRLRLDVSKAKGTECVHVLERLLIPHHSVRSDGKQVPATLIPDLVRPVAFDGDPAGAGTVNSRRDVLDDESLRREDNAFLAATCPQRCRG